MTEPLLSELASASVDTIRRSLLKPTLEFAATHIPYYRKAWGEVWREVDSPQALARLPLLKKAQAIEYQAELTHPRSPIRTGVAARGASITATKAMKP